MSEDLAAWLLEQLAEDERVAGEELERRSRYQAEMAASGSVNAIVLLPFDDPGAPGDPERALVECAAKRRIVEWHREETLPDGVPTRTGLCEVCMNWAWPCHTLRMLALPYVDRPGYRAEWTPDTPG